MPLIEIYLIITHIQILWVHGIKQTSPNYSTHQFIKIAYAAQQGSDY